MIDYFEAIGRLVSYPELRESLPSGPKLKPMNAAMTKDQKSKAWQLDQRLRLDFRVDDYNDETYIAVQENFADVLSEGFLSFPSAGELLWTYNRLQNASATVQALYRTVATLAAQATQKLPGPSTAYFIALGALIADKSFIQKLKGGPVDREGRLAQEFLRRLSSSEKDTIIDLAKGEFGTTAMQLYDDFWDDACGPGLFRMPVPVHSSR